MEKASPWPFTGMIGLACTAFLIGASALLSPWWLVLLLALVWVAALVLAVRWWTPHPRRLPAVAGAVALVWVVAVVGQAALS
ncbi:hypothetical protein GCM10009623_35110 [Nocardioides aestuarii]|uniref:DUF4175 domain-containing protein n=1 Tax=Nocardioides aestuarii TaxID=252231 RepID=A0ABW4TVS3_9ACTN